mmetsp:Transcript_66961/g.145512  ORF Transcript_66961/g.145512 Transcript_66961/m.145512 type:complete len:247 (-) Transcript_66961:844-1584(-)
MAGEAFLGLPAMGHDLQVLGRLLVAGAEALPLDLQLVIDDFDSAVGSLFQGLLLGTLVLLDVHSLAPLHLLLCLHDHAVDKDTLRGWVGEGVWLHGLGQVILEVKLAIRFLLLELVVDEGRKGLEEPLVHVVELRHDLLLHLEAHGCELAGGRLPHLHHAQQLLVCLLRTVPAMAADVVLVSQDVVTVRPSVQLAGDALAEANDEALVRLWGFGGVGLPAFGLGDEAVEGEAALPLLEVTGVVVGE